METSALCPLLIVDDSQDHQDLLRQLFENAGFRILTASNGQEALDLLHSNEQTPCCILLDLMMPVMDGYVFRAEQLKVSRFASIPVIVMSASAHVEEQTRKLGVSGFIKKPVDIDDLLNTAERFCVL